MSAKGGPMAAGSWAPEGESGCALVVPSSKRFLGRRKAGSPERFARHVREAIDDWSELKLKTALGMEFRQTGRVVLVRPWWLPGPLYRALLRTIVIETKDVGVR